MTDFDECVRAVMAKRYGVRFDYNGNPVGEDRELFAAARRQTERDMRSMTAQQIAYALRDLGARPHDDAAYDPFGFARG